MGIPITSDPSSQAQVPPPSTSTTDPQTANAAMPTSAATHTPATPSELPPAALELAGKLFEGARQGDIAMLSQYLQAGIPTNLTNHSGDTLLMLASYHGHTQLVRLLLEKGADPNMINGRGQSIIAGAVFKGHEEVVKLLYEKGAEIRQGTPDAVQTARMFRNTPILEFFGVREEDEPPLPGQVPQGPGMSSTSTANAQAQAGQGA